MPTIRTFHLPTYPPCWKTCGDCGASDIFIQSVLVSVGQRLRCDEVVVVLETGKVALDIPSPWAGEVLAVHVAENDPAQEGDAVITVACED